jgi:DNA-binding GntR family transcriptional regulator
VVKANRRRSDVGTADDSRRAQVADALRGQILGGRLRPGDLLPAERELATAHRVSRDTVRAALAQLVAEGLITAGDRRRGRTVRAYNPLVTLLHRLERGARRDDPALALDDWAAGVREQGRAPRQVVTVEVDLPATDEVADWLGIEPGDSVVRRHRMRYVDDEPSQVVDSWFPSDIARTPLPGSDRRPLLEAGDVVLPNGILRSIGHPQTHARDRICARPASAEELRDLRLPPGTAMLRHIRIGYGVGGRPVRVMVTNAPGDRNVFVYEMDL